MFQGNEPVRWRHFDFEGVCMCEQGARQKVARSWRLPGNGVSVQSDAIS